jgi:hypothetical protein
MKQVAINIKNSQNRTLLEKPAVAQIIKKSSKNYGTLNVLFCAEDSSICPYPKHFLIFILITSTSSTFMCPTYYFPLRISGKMYGFPIFPIHTHCLIQCAHHLNNISIWRRAQFMQHVSQLSQSPFSSCLNDLFPALYFSRVMGDTFFKFISGVGVKWSPLLRRPFIGLLYNPWMIDSDDYGAISGVYEWPWKPKY